MKDEKNPDIIFSCKKCGHLVYINKKNMRKIISLINKDCLRCGEEKLWLLYGEGNYKKEELEERLSWQE